MPIRQCLFQLLDWLCSDVSNPRLSLGTCLGFCLALIPASTLHGALLWSTVLVLRVNVCVVLGSFLFFSLLVSPFDPIFHVVGYAVLTPNWLHRLWAGLYHMPVTPYTRFNNTLVMGRTLAALFATLPLYWLMNLLLHHRRAAIVRWIQQSPVWESWAHSRLHRLYASYRKSER